MIQLNDPILRSLSTMTGQPPIALMTACSLDALRLGVRPDDLLNAAWTVETVVQDIKRQIGQ